MMIELSLLWFLALAVMAKAKGKRRKFRRYMRGAIDFALTLGTLGASTLISGTLGDAVTEKAWLSSIKCRWSLGNLTPSSGDGPIMVGVAHSDYTDAEMEEWIENTGSWEETDKIQQREVGRRLIRMVGTFDVRTVATEVVVLNDGKFIHTKCGWSLGTGQTIKIWAYNVGTNALETTSPLVSAFGHANLWPQ